jgi:hypothetical protein
MPEARLGGGSWRTAAGRLQGKENGMGPKFFGLMMIAGLAAVAGLGRASHDVAAVAFGHHHGWCGCGGWCGGGGYDFDDDDACGWSGCGSWCGGCCSGYSCCGGYASCGWCSGYSSCGYASGGGYSSCCGSYGYGGYGSSGYGSPSYGSPSYGYEGYGYSGCRYPSAAWYNTRLSYGLPAYRYMMPDVFPNVPPYTAPNYGYPSGTQNYGDPSSTQGYGGNFGAVNTGTPAYSAVSAVSVGSTATVGADGIPEVNLAPH